MRDLSGVRVARTVGQVRFLNGRFHDFGTATTGLVIISHTRQLHIGYHDARVAIRLLRF